MNEPTGPPIPLPDYPALRDMILGELRRLWCKEARLRAELAEVRRDLQRTLGGLAVVRKAEVDARNRGTGGESS